MGNWNLGSVADFVLDVIENVPTAISGTRLLEMADQSREIVENYTGTSIGSDAIDIKYQSVVSNFTCGKVLKSMEMIGIDTQSIKLGDLSVSKGQGGPASSTSDKFREEGWRELRELGKSVSFYKALG
jgi:hypothetical protein